MIYKDVRICFSRLNLKNKKKHKIVVLYKKRRKARFKSENYLTSRVKNGNRMNKSVSKITSMFYYLMIE